MKNIFIIVGVLLIIGIAYFALVKNAPDTSKITPEDSGTVVPSAEETQTAPVVENDEAQPEVDLTKTVIGSSVDDRDIVAYHYGTGDTELLFIGGIHGGYEWNTALVAYELMDYLDANPSAIPSNIRVTVIPVLNPDGLSEVVGDTERFTKADIPTPIEKTIPGRFNANNVDLNRNFDCDWQSNGVWQNTQVSGGSKAFSEPESQAIKSYVAAHAPTAAVVWYSAAGGVFASNCHSEVLPETLTLTNLYAKASGYAPYESFDFYAITGDMVNWLAKEDIPAISVLLTTHEDTEWTKNLAGIKAVLEHYSE